MNAIIEILLELNNSIIIDFIYYLDKIMSENREEVIRLTNYLHVMKTVLLEREE